MTGLFRSIAAALLFVAILSIPTTAAAAPTWMEADKHFRRGVDLFRESNYRAALVEFQRAYEIDPKWQVLYNIGKSHNQLHDYANALASFERYLADGGTKISPRRKKEVEDEIATLTGRVATLTVTTSEPGASIAVDDVAVGKTPLAAFKLSAGRHRVTATIQGRPTVTEVIDLAGGDERKLALEIAPLPPPVVDKPKKPQPPGPSIVPMVVSWSVTGALATSAVITGVLALSASDDLEDELGRFPAQPDAISDAKTSAFRLGLATDILIGASVVGAGLGAYFTIEWSLASDKLASEAEPAARLQIVPGGLTLDGTF